MLDSRRTLWFSQRCYLHFTPRVLHFSAVHLYLVTNHFLSLWCISAFRTSLIFVLLFLCLCIPSASLFFCVSINAFCCLGRGAAHPVKPAHTCFVSIFVVLLSMCIITSGGTILLAALRNNPLPPLHTSSMAFS